MDEAQEVGPILVADEARAVREPDCLQMAQQHPGGLTPRMQRMPDDVAGPDQHAVVATPRDLHRHRLSIDPAVTPPIKPARSGNCSVSHGYEKLREPASSRRDRVRGNSAAQSLSAEETGRLGHPMPASRCGDCATQASSSGCETSTRNPQARAVSCPGSRDQSPAVPGAHRRQRADESLT